MIKSNQRLSNRAMAFVLAGGKGGVGVTTLAVNLSVGLADQGARVVVVDADLYRSDVAVLCGIAERSTVEDVLIARRDVHEGSSRRLPGRVSRRIDALPRIPDGA